MKLYKTFVIIICNFGLHKLIFILFIVVYWLNTLVKFLLFCLKTIAYTVHCQYRTYHFSCDWQLQLPNLSLLYLHPFHSNEMMA